MHRSLFRFTLMFLLGALLWPVRADAQETEQSFVRASRGLTVAAMASAVRTDAASAVENPALAALAESFDGHYAFATSTAFGAGHGLYAMLPVMGLGLSVGAELLSIENQSPFLRRYALGASAKLTDFLAIGIRYDIYGSDTELDLDQATSLALGLSMRPIPQLAASVLLENVNTPRFGDEWLELVGQVGLGVVLLDGALRAEGSYHWGLPDANEGRVDALLAGRAFRGLELFGQVQMQSELLRWGGGVRLDLGPIDLVGAGYGLSTTTQDIDFDGFSVGLGLHAKSADALILPSERWLSISIPGQMDERGVSAPFGMSAPSFADLLGHLRAISEDPSVQGVVLRIAGSSMSYAQLWELRRSVARIRSEGKSVIAHLDDGSMRSFYLASSAQRIYMSPAQVLSARGVSSTMSYYRDFLDMIGIEPEFVKIDEYKSAPDSFLRNAPTACEQEQIQDYLDGIFEELVESLASSRGLDPSQLRALIDNMPLTPPEAVAAQLIDAVAYADELPGLIARELGLSAPPRIERNAAATLPREQAWDSKPVVAVIHIDGSIVQGASLELPLVGSTMTGSDTIVSALEWALSSREVVAIVLRVNSPGGSAHGSDLVNRALQRASAVKPLVVSMASTATSGAYYVSVPARRIFATPMTLTGSIGIFAGKASVHKLFSWLGINQHTVKRGRFADLFSLAEPWDAQERAQMQKQVEYLYQIFLERVISARSPQMDVAHLRSIAEGHVYGGDAALAIGLVDEIGGLEEAVAYAASLAGEDEAPSLVQLPRRSAVSALIPRFGFDFSSVTWETEPPIDTPISLELTEMLAPLSGFPFVFDAQATMLLPYTLSIEP